MKFKGVDFYVKTRQPEPIQRTQPSTSRTCTSGCQSARPTMTTTTETSMPIVVGSRNTAAVSALQASAISAIWTAGPAVFTRLAMSFPLITPLPTRTATKRAGSMTCRTMLPALSHILEERELLDALMCKLDELDPDGRRICELLLQEKSEREIATIMGISRQSTINYKKKKAFESFAGSPSRLHLIPHPSFSGCLSWWPEKTFLRFSFKQHSHLHWVVERAKRQALLPRR